VRLINVSLTVGYVGDIIESQLEGWTPSPIKTINGEDVVDYLKKFATLNSGGYLEGHTEWNALMSSPALDIQSRLTVWAGGASFYPGENLTVHFENYTSEDDGTVWETEFFAIYNEYANYTGPLTTGGDFYNYFVLGNTPASFDPDRIVYSDSETDSEVAAAPGNWLDASFGAYPENPDVAQYDLGPDSVGIVSGYFFDTISTGVLSLPSFDALDETIGNYSATVKEFIVGASEAKLDNVIIDLQGNSGGLTLLAYTTFKLFFPDEVPFGGSRRRLTPLANALGSATTKYWESLDESDPDELELKQELGADNWLITNRLNAATGQNFSSWEEYATAINYNEDTFSQIEQYDLSNKVFDQAAFFQWYPGMYVEPDEDWTRNWDPEQITLLTDGTCASTCSLFVEMMTRAGVKTVVAGGRPQPGPMQAVSGNRGAAIYSTDELDVDLLFARDIDVFVNDNVNASVPEVRESGMYITYASVNLRDQVRVNETTPLQFKYEAADCRVYYTLANLYNFTRLWHDVAAAVADPSLCVEGSTGFSTTNNTNPSPPPVSDAERPTIVQDNPVVEQVEFEEDPTDGLRNGDGYDHDSDDFGPCRKLATQGEYCNSGFGQCTYVSFTCTGVSYTRLKCLPLCQCTAGGDCQTCPGNCVTNVVLESKPRPVTPFQPEGVCFLTKAQRDRRYCPSKPPPSNSNKSKKGKKAT
jgi:hypothetical protein